jgi:hypothetical protein
VRLLHDHLALHPREVRQVDDLEGLDHADEDDGLAAGDARAFALMLLGR